MSDYIEIKGARVNNLKNINVKIPRNKLVVVAGVSGSGKSSLAFDTLYAEGQRRYVESLSSYARQFLGRMNKPECDFIKGIPPAIAIEQKVISRNPRSTVGTTTEIYEYLRLLFARIGITYSPISGQEVKKHSTEDIVKCTQQYQPGTKYVVMAPIKPVADRTMEQQLRMYVQNGYARMAVNGEIMRIDDWLEKQDTTSVTQDTPLYLVVDRLSVDNAKDVVSRLIDSAETAFYEGSGECRLMFLPSNICYDFSMRFEADGMTFEEPSDQLFSFNSPVGACPECQGFGKIIGIDEHLVIPNTTLSVYDGCVVCWHGEKMKIWKEEFCRRAAKDDFPIFEPYYNLTQKQKDQLWHGLPSDRNKDIHEQVSIDAFFQMVKESQYKIQYRVMLSRYRGKTTCPKCHGTRLKPEADYVKIGGRSISDLVQMPVIRLKTWFDQLEFTEQEKQISRRLITEINSRLQFLLDVGLGYLTLNRMSNTLSGGESQRINLTTSLGSSLVGSLYILDEPSIGLHSRDTDRLIKVLKELRDLGNTVVIVEHDEEIMRAADYLIDVGPDAGRFGGEIVFEGHINDVNKQALKKFPHSYTLRYLTHDDQIPVPKSRRPWNQAITVKGARMNNLQGIDVHFPLNVMTVVTGVSGSGKSSLVKGILYPSLKRHLGEVFDVPGEYMGLAGDYESIKHVEFVDQLLVDIVGQVDRHADGVVDPFLDFALHPHLHEPVDVIGRGFVIRRLSHQLVDFLLGVAFLGVETVNSHPREEFGMVDDVLLERVAHLVDKVDMHVGVAWIDLPAAFVDGHEHRFDAAGGLGHEAGSTRWGDGETSNVAAPIFHHIVVKFRVGLFDSLHKRVVLLAFGVVDGELAPLLGHGHRRAISAEGQSSVYVDGEPRGLLTAISQSECGYHVALSGDAHSRAPSQSALVVDFLPQVILCPLHLIVLRVVFHLFHDALDLLQFKVHDVVHDTLSEGHVLRELVEIELGLRSEGIVDIRVEVDGKKPT